MFVWQIYRSGKTSQTSEYFLFSCLLLLFGDKMKAYVVLIAYQLIHTLFSVFHAFSENFFVVVADFQLTKLVKTFAGMCIVQSRVYCSMKSNNSRGFSLIIFILHCFHRYLLKIRIEYRRRMNMYQRSMYKEICHTIFLFHMKYHREIKDMPLSSVVMQYGNV